VISSSIDVIMGVKDYPTKVQGTKFDVCESNFEPSRYRDLDIVFNGGFQPLSVPIQ